MHADDPTALARQHGTAAVQTLIAHLDGPDAVQAAIALLAVGYGHPVQPLAFDAGSISVEVNAAGEPDALHRMNGDDGTAPCPSAAAAAAS
jgi:hypothetical protein